MEGYWRRYTPARLSRRRALAATGTSLLGAALLAACGGGNSGDKAGKSAGLVVQPVDTTKQAKAGGVYKSLVLQDVQTFEPSFRSAPTAFASSHAYQNLVTQKPGYLAPAPDEYIGDAVESWEFSPDKLTMTFKIRTEGKWDARPPTSSRNVDASDVAFAWNRFAEVGSLRADLSNKVNPAAPIISMTAPDSKTVTVKLAKPQASILAAVSSRAASGFWIVPKESESGFDMRKEQRGSGAYVLSEYVPSSRFVFDKSPGYWNKDGLAVQRIEFPIISEYAQSMAQLKAGSLFTFVVRSEDILPTKNGTPELNLYQTDITSTGFRWFFGWEPSAKSPFKDVRLRQAFSMAIDRDLFIDTFSNVPTFEAAGVQMATAWNTAVRCDAPGWWLDPQAKDFGENAKFYKHDLAEAKKLVSAGGFASGLDVDAHHISTGDYGPEFPNQVQTVIGMVQEAGMRLKSVPANFATDWQQKYRDVKGNFDGVAFLLQVGSGDAGDLLYALYNKNGSQFMGFDPNGQSTFRGDPLMDDLTEKMKIEFDQKKRYALAYDLQKYEAKMQFYPMFPGGANGFQLVWPAVENWAVYRGGFFVEAYVWINDQKAPLKRS